MKLFFDIETVYFCETELSEVELFICMKMDLALNNLQWLMCPKIKPNLMLKPFLLKNSNDTI